MRAKPWILVLLGVLLGCGATAAGTAIHASRAQSAAIESRWSCYETSEFPDVKEAARSDSANEVRKGMDEVAPAAREGSIVTLLPKRSGNEILCVKYR